MTPKRHHGVLAPTLLLLALCLTSVYPAQLRATHATSLSEGLESPGWQEHSVTVDCTQDDMIISISPKASGVSFLDNDIYSKESSGFSGSIYPRGLGRAGGCLTKYRQAPGPVTYRLPLRACNTMPYTMDDGSVEYRNVLMVQPHPRLVTGLGRAHHVSCRPPPHSPALALQDSQPKAARLSDVREYHHDIDVSSQPTDGRPAYSMKIYRGDPALKEIATNVKIGDPLTLVISIDKELGKHGIKVTDCTVKDGLGWASQNLLNDDGCPLDTEIMGKFYYSADGSQASVTFQAHKFPYTASVYYQCAVKLCGAKDSKQCEPTCGGKNQIRARRQADEKETPAKIEVFSGLYVNEATDSTPDTDFVTKEKNPEDAICISQRNFAIAICIAGLILMLAVVTAILVILARRRGTKSVSNTGSSIYSGPYTNTGYSHDS